MVCRGVCCVASTTNGHLRQASLRAAQAWNPDSVNRVRAPSQQFRQDFLQSRLRACHQGTSSKAPRVCIGSGVFHVLAVEILRVHVPVVVVVRAIGTRARFLLEIDLVVVIVVDPVATRAARAAKLTSSRRTYG
jgi:hypothetical protein